jgi:hypothetical protein
VTQRVADDVQRQLHQAREQRLQRQQQRRTQTVTVGASPIVTTIAALPSSAPVVLGPHWQHTHVHVRDGTANRTRRAPPPSQSRPRLAPFSTLLWKWLSEWPVAS